MCCDRICKEAVLAIPQSPYRVGYDSLILELVMEEDKSDRLICDSPYADVGLDNIDGPRRE